MFFFWEAMWPSLSSFLKHEIELALWLKAFFNFLKCRSFAPWPTRFSQGETRITSFAVFRRYTDGMSISHWHLLLYLIGTVDPLVISVSFWLAVFLLEDSLPTFAPVISAWFLILHVFLFFLIACRLCCFNLCTCCCFPLLMMSCFYLSSSLFVVLGNENDGSVNRTTIHFTWRRLVFILAIVTARAEVHDVLLPLQLSSMLFLYAAIALSSWSLSLSLGDTHAI